jgi:hypothetical protein
VTRRERLDAAYALVSKTKKVTRLDVVRLDGALVPSPRNTDRQVALALIGALGYDGVACESDGRPVHDHSDAYVCEFALAAAGDVRTDDMTADEIAKLDDITGWRR